MRSRELELRTREEKLLAWRNRIASKLSGDEINELVENLNDYSVYSLFEPIMLMISCNDGYVFFESVDKESPMLDEENICRRKVYYLLKWSGYDDFYIGDNIERYTGMLLNFYSNPDRIINLFDYYDDALNYEKEGKIKIKKLK